MQEEVGQLLGLSERPIWRSDLLEESVNAGANRPIERRWGWIVAAVAIVAAEGLILGPSLHF